MKMNFFGFDLNPTEFDQVQRAINGLIRLFPGIKDGVSIWPPHVMQRLTASTVQQIKIALGQLGRESECRAA